VNISGTSLIMKNTDINCSSILWRDSLTVEHDNIQYACSTFFVGDILVTSIPMT